ncbi:MAG: flagellar biosynthetic protein FliR [Myxococcaceae bacterium]
MNLEELGGELRLLAPHLVAVALCAARLLPVTFLCPLLGGQSAPTTVRLALVLAFALSVHFAGGVMPPPDVDSMWTLGAYVGKELIFGTAMGLVASLPFDAARIGGRFIDLFRGSSAEASLPVAGSRESATGDGLYQLVVALAATGVAFPILMSAVWKSYALVPLGGFSPTESAAMQVVAFAGVTFATGLAIGAPIAGCSLAVDCLLGVVSRAAPQMNLQEMGSPLRILGGGAVIWLLVGVLSERVLAGILDAEWVLHAIYGAVS